MRAANWARIYLFNVNVDVVRLNLFLFVSY